MSQTWKSRGRRFATAGVAAVAAAVTLFVPLPATAASQDFCEVLSHWPGCPR